MISQLGKPQTTNAMAIPLTDAALFQDLLAGFATGEGVEEESLQADAMIEPEQPEQPEETQTDGMDEAMIQAMQQFIRLPIPQTAPQEQPVQDNVSPELAVLSTPPTNISLETPEIAHDSSMAESELVGGEDVSEEEFAAFTGLNKEKFVPQAGAIERPQQIEVTVPRTNTSELKIERPTDRQRDTQPVGDFIVDEKQNLIINKQVEKPPVVEVAQTETPIFNMTQTATPPIVQTATALPEVTQTTLVWQEPTQVIRELGETISITLEQSPTPATKVVQIALTPETFGEMEIQLTWQEDNVSARIVVEKAEIKQQLVEHMELIREFLPKNPIVQTIMIDVRPLNVPFQAQHGFQSRKQSQQNGKNHVVEEKEWEEQEQPRPQEARGLSLYI